MSRKLDSDRIAADIEAFLAAGGTIQKLRPEESSGCDIEAFTSRTANVDHVFRNKPDYRDYAHVD